MKCIYQAFVLLMIIILSCKCVWCLKRVSAELQFIYSYEYCKYSTTVIPLSLVNIRTDADGVTKELEFLGVTMEPSEGSLRSTKKPKVPFRIGSVTIIVSTPMGNDRLVPALAG